MSAAVRFDRLDALRGAAIVWMAVFHFCFDLAWFGFLVVLLSFTSGPAQGMHRYILASPPVFLLLSRWGKNQSFDRAWTIASVLVMGMMAMLFSFDMWTG